MQKCIINENFVEVARQAVHKELFKLQLESIQLKIKMGETMQTAEEQKVSGTEMKNHAESPIRPTSSFNGDEFNAFIENVYGCKLYLPFFVQFFDQLEEQVERKKSCKGMILKFIETNLLMIRRNYRMIEQRLKR